MSWEQARRGRYSGFSEYPRTVVSVVTAVQGPAEGQAAQILTHTEGIALVRRCADTTELLGVAQAGIGNVAVVGADLPGFDRELVSLLNAQGVQIVALNDPEDQFSSERLKALGITVSVSPAAIDEDLVRVVAEVGALGSTGPARSGGSGLSGASGLSSGSPTNTPTTSPDNQPMRATENGDATTGALSGGAAATAENPDINDVELTVQRDDLKQVRSGNSPASPSGVTVKPEDGIPDYDSALTDWSYAAQQLIEETADVLRRESLGILPTQPAPTQPVAPVPPSFAPDQGDGSSHTLFSRGSSTPSTASEGIPQVPPPPPSSPFSFVPEPPAHTDPSGTNGKIVAVWGAHGAPGRSTIAAGLAYALSRGVAQRADASGPEDAKHGVGTGGQAIRTGRWFSRKRSSHHKQSGEATILIDADTYAPSLAQALGLLEESSGLALSCRHANQGTLNTATLTDSAMSVAENLTLLTGLPRPERWNEIPHYALEAVYEQVKQNAGWTVVDCAPPIEQDQSIAFDSHAPGRNAATLTTLESADLVVIVGKADPVGIKRLIDSITQFKELHPDRPYLVVVNHAPTRVSGKDRRSQITKALKRFADEDAPYFIGDDQSLAHNALEWGKAVTENRSKSELPTAIDSLAAMISAGFATRRTT